MRRGPKSKPTFLHHLHGTIQQRHKLRPPDAVAHGKLDEPPADLTEEEQACWRHALEHAPAGLLAKIDTSILRLWAITEARFLAARRAQAMLDGATKAPMLVRTRAGDMVPSPYIGIMNKATTLMLRMTEQLGFCPTARVGLGGASADESDGTDNRWVRLEEMRRKAANA